eukprot:scaffold90819_cov13-Tisochrysis_lutea.AAC.1
MALTVTYAAPTMKHCSEEATWVHRRLQLCSALCDKFTKLSCWDTAWSQKIVRNLCFTDFQLQYGR